MIRTVFMGTPDFAATALRALIKGTHEVALVVTWPDRPSGRGARMTPSPVKVVAEEIGLPLLQVERVNTVSVREAIASVDPDVIVVVAFGAILRPKLLALAPHGCLNVHASLLPRHRGASPINAAILAGDSNVGVSLMRMDEGLDTGPVLLTRSTASKPHETAGELHDRLAVLGAEVLMTGLDQIEAGQATFEPQDHCAATTCGLMTKADGRIDFSATAEAVDRHVRGYLPWPGNTAVLQLSSGKRELSVLRALPVPWSPAEAGLVVEVGRDSFTIACGEGALEVSRLRPKGKRSMAVSDFLNGTPVSVGDTFET